MPILIKKIDGKRTCQTMNKTKSIQDELIEALKGLTLKLEVKVVDVMASVQSYQEPLSGYQPPREVIKPPAAESPVAVPKTMVAKEFERQAEAARDPVQVQEQSRSRVDLPDNGLEVALRKQLHREPEQPKISTPSSLVIDAIKPPVAKPILTKLEPPKPAAARLPAKPILVKGELKIGTKIQVYFTIDDSSTPYTMYLPYDNVKLVEMSKTMADQTPIIETLPLANTINPGDIIFGKSLQDNIWYRALVESSDEFSYNVYYFDWGLREKLSLKRIRLLTLPELGLTKYPACAVKVKISNMADDAATQFLDQESAFPIKVNSYDDKTDTYIIEALQES